MFLSQTVFVLWSKHLLLFNLTQLSVMKVFLINIEWIVSTRLKNTVLNYYQEIKLADISLDIVNLIIENMNEFVGYLTISGYEHLQSIEILRGSLQNILSLTINNNPLLKSISIGSNACEYTISACILSSDYRFASSHLIFLN